MALPKYKTRRSKSRSRRAHAFYHTLEKVELVRCPRCRAYKQAHYVCPSCGYYAGELVYRIKVKEEEEEQA